MRRRPVVMTVTGLNLTEDAEQRIGQAVMLVLAHHCEMDGVAITFTTERS